MQGSRGAKGAGGKHPLALAPLPPCSFILRAEDNMV